MTSKRSSWIGWIIVLCSIAVGGIALDQFVPDMRKALSEPASLGFDEHLSNVDPGHVPWLLEHTGGRWGRYGWYLSAGETGLLRIRMPGSENGVLKLRIWAFSPGQLSVRISDGTDSHEIPLSHLDSRLLHYPVNGSSELIVAASNPLSEEQLVLDRFAVAWSRIDDHLPSSWPLGVAVAMCLVGFLLICGTHKESVPWPLWLGSFAILAASVAGFVLRWDLLDLARGLPVDPDVLAYIAYARSLDWFTADHGFYSGSFSEREPLHIAMIHLWAKFWGDTLPAVRWYTVMISMLLVPSIGVFIWGVSGHWLIGASAAWIMALNPVVVEESVRGLRLEGITFLLLLGLSAWLWGRGWLGAMMLGLTIGLMALTQSPTLTILLSMVWLAWVLSRFSKQWVDVHFVPAQWKWPHLLLASFLALAMFVPHLYGLYKSYGDPSWPSSRYARWNANFEFPDRIGTPGFPSAEEFSRDVYAGPVMTYTEYLFGLHSFPTLVYGQIKGWAESTAYMSTSVTPHLKELIFLYHASGFRAVLRHLTPSTVVVFVLSLGLTALGFVELAMHPKYWWVPTLSIVGTWYAAYLYSVRLVEPFRHTGHVYPLLLFCLIWGSYRVYLWLADRFRFVTCGLLPLSVTVRERTESLPD